MPPEPTNTNICKASAPSLEMRNAYFLSMSLQNIRCFGPKQLLSFTDATGNPARWTLILGDNGVGKTTLMQVLALAGSIESTSPSGEASLSKILRWVKQSPLGLFDLPRIGQSTAKVTYDIAWSCSLGQSEHVTRDSWSLESTRGSWSMSAPHQREGFTLHGYGANRRRAPKGMTSEASDDPTKTLFDDDATLRNPEEWLLQNELVANTASPLQERARRQRGRVVEILTRILPGVADIRVSPYADANQQLRANVEVEGPDGWVPFSSLGLGYRAPRSVRKWRVDQILTSELFDIPSARAPELDEWITERDAVLAKSDLTVVDEQRLAELREKLDGLPQGDTPEDIEAMELIRQAAKALKDKNGP